MIKKKRPVLQDIADRLGITKMTVSRYLRDPKQVSPDLGQKIAVVIEDIGYIPNRVPDILSNATSRAIGVLLPSLTNQVFADILKGIETITDRTGYQTLIAHFGYDPAKEERLLRAMLGWNIDGIILTERAHTAATLRMLEVAGIPVVEMMDTTRPCLDMAVGYDNRAAAQAMTERMIGKGFKHTVYLGARLDSRTLQREQGYQQAMQIAGLEPRSILSTASSSYTLGGELLLQAQRRYPVIDSVFCTNDDIAIGAMFECQRQDLKVPQQMAIAGFHGHDISQVVSPQLATVLTPRMEIGQQAAKMVFSRLKGEPVLRTIVDLGYRIVEGESI